MTVHINDLEAKSMPFEMIRSLRHATERDHHESAQGFIFIFMRQGIQCEDFLELIYFQHAIEKPGTVLSLCSLRLLHFDLSDDLFDHIVNCKQTLQAAEFINHKQQL